MSALLETSGDLVNKAVLAAIAEQLWGWINAHLDDDVLHINWKVFGIPIRKTFKVRDLLPFAELLLGPDPGTPA